MALRSFGWLSLAFFLTASGIRAQGAPQSASVPPSLLPPYPVPIDAAEMSPPPGPPPEIIANGPVNVTPTGVLAYVEAGATFIRLPGRGGSPSVDLDTSPDLHVVIGLPFEWNDRSEMLLFGYRHLTSEGDTSLPICDGMPPARFHGEIDLSQVDLDFYRRTVLGPRVTREAWLGVRVANFSLDERIEAFDAIQHGSSDFYGAGPHAGLGYSFALGDRGLSLFGQGDIAVLYGGVRLRDEVDVPGAYLSTFSQTHGRAMLNGGLRGGLDWRLPLRSEKGPQFHVAGGYQVEFWSHSSQSDSNNSNDSNDVTDLVSHGPFLRLEVQY